MNSKRTKTARKNIKTQWRGALKYIVQPTLGTSGHSRIEG